MGLFALFKRKKESAEDYLKDFVKLAKQIGESEGKRKVNLIRDLAENIAGIVDPLLLHGIITILAKKVWLIDAEQLVFSFLSNRVSNLINEINDVTELRELKNKIGRINHIEPLIDKRIEKLKLYEGYALLDESAKVYIAVVCKTDRLQAPKEDAGEYTYHEKLNDRLEELLMQTGVGLVIGSSTGLGFTDGVFGFDKSEPIEISCKVIDLDIAKKVIENDLAKTEFSDFEIIMIEGDNE